MAHYLLRKSAFFVVFLRQNVFFGVIFGELPSFLRGPRSILHMEWKSLLYLRCTTLQALDLLFKCQALNSDFDNILIPFNHELLQLLFLFPQAFGLLFELAGRIDFRLGLGLYILILLFEFEEP